MEILSSPKHYLFNLYTTSSSEANRLWRRKIKEKWGNECAYCGSEENLTIDHVIPRSKGGMDTSKNMVCCCESCNQDKAHTPWKEWYSAQDFFNIEQYNRIQEMLLEYFINK
jgi:hypothetical protein